MQTEMRRFYLNMTVQYGGDGARQLMATRGTPLEYRETLLKDLGEFGFPSPHTSTPVYLSGRVQCVWITSFLSEEHLLVRASFLRASKGSKSLEQRHIRYILLDDGGELFTTANSPGKGPGGQRLIRMSNVLPNSQVSARRKVAEQGLPPVREPEGVKASNEPTSVYEARRQSARAPLHPENVGESSSHSQSSEVMFGTPDVVRPRLRMSRFDVLDPSSESAQSDRPEKHIPTGPKSMSKASLTMSEQHTSRDAEVSSGAVSASSKGDANSLTRELWDIRRQMTALKAREDTLQRELQRMRVPIGLEQPTSSMSAMPPEPEEQREPQGEINKLRKQLSKESSMRYAAQTALENERHRRKYAEGVLDDCRRESTGPFIVPALMDAFIKLAELTSSVSDEAELDYGSVSADKW